VAIMEEAMMLKNCILTRCFFLDWECEKQKSWDV
jgi:hypothetical protein